MIKVAIVSFKGEVYWGNPSGCVWHFTEINGIKHFRAEKKRGEWWYNYEDQEDVKGIDFGNNDAFYTILKNTST